MGGIEPRKGSDTLMAAVAALGRSEGRGLAVRGFSPLPLAAGPGYAPFQWQRTACPLPSQRRPAPGLATRTRVFDSRLV